MIPDWMGLVIGSADDLSENTLHKVARNVKLLIRRLPPTTAIDIAIGGYDEDPREIFEIPEARRYIIGFAAELTYSGIPLTRLLPRSADLVRVCLAAEEGRAVFICDPADIDMDIRSQIEEYRERVRRDRH